MKFEDFYNESFRDFQKSPRILKWAAADPKYPGTSRPLIRDAVLKVF
jgi:hypothetical protein